MWHVERKQEQPSTPPSHDSNSNAITFPLPHSMDEWELLSQMRPGNNIHIDDLEMLGHRDFDKNHNWTHKNITTDLHHIATSFIDLNCLSNSPDSLSPTQCIGFDVVISHFRNTTSAPSLKMLIQGTAGTGKSYLVYCLKTVVQSASEQSTCRDSFHKHELPLPIIYSDRVEYEHSK